MNEFLWAVFGALIVYLSVCGVLFNAMELEGFEHISPAHWDCTKQEPIKEALPQKYECVQWEKKDVKG